MNASAKSPLLVGLAKAGLTQQPGEGVREILAAFGEPDWAELIRLGDLHGVTPLLCAGLRPCKVSPPGAVGQTLRKQAIASELRCQQAMDQLRDVLAAFNKHGLRPMVLKGALFAQTYYRSPGLRSFTDLDIAVPVSQREPASDVLIALGYRPYEEAGRRGLSWWTENHHHWIFKLDRGLPIELHWALTPPSSSVQFDMDSLWLRAEAICLSGADATMLTPEDSIVHIAVHIAKHLFCVPLRSFMDLAAILSFRPSIDWEAVWLRAQEVGAATDIGLTLAVAEGLGLLQAPVALVGRVHACMSSATSIPELARYVIEWPYLDVPVSLDVALEGSSARSTIGKILRTAFPRKQHLVERYGDGAPGAPPAAGYWKLWSRHAGRGIKKFWHIRTQAVNMRSRNKIRRLFGDREGA